MVAQLLGTAAQVLLLAVQIWFTAQAAVPQAHAARFLAVPVVSTQAAVQVPAPAFPLARQMLFAGHTAPVPHKHWAVFTALSSVLVQAEGTAAHVPAPEFADERQI